MDNALTARIKGAKIQLRSCLPIIVEAKKVVFSVSELVNGIAQIAGQMSFGIVALSILHRIGQVLWQSESK